MNSPCFTYETPCPVCGEVMGVWDNPQKTAWVVHCWKCSHNHCDLPITEDSLQKLNAVPPLDDTCTPPNGFIWFPVMLFRLWKLRRSTDMFAIRKEPTWFLREMQSVEGHLELTRAARTEISRRELAASRHKPWWAKNA